MSTRALIVGADAYQLGPPTGAVADALSFRDALVGLGLVAAADVTLLTSPAVADGAGPATHDAIAAVLEDLYFNGDAIERFFFYFAGHGLLAFRDVALSQPGTALMPVDATEIERNARNLIHLDEVLGAMRLAGPQEQLYFIDACRDLPYTRHPAVSSLGWGSRTPGRARRQAVLYAVSELGQAHALPTGGGRMTQHLVGALHGRGRALDYDLEHDRYVVTMPSVRDYVRAQLGQQLAGRGLDLAAALPALQAGDPEPAPIREVIDPGQRQLTVHIRPDAAAPSTTIEVGLGRGAVVHSWPPVQNHETVLLDPKPHRLTAHSAHGIPDPASSYVDVREQDEATVRVNGRPGGRPDRRRPRVVSHSASPLLSRFRGGGPSAPPAPRAPASGRLVAVGRSGVAGVDVTGLQPPYAQRSELGAVDAELPPGGYRVDFRLGRDVVATTTVHLARDERVTVEAPPLPRPASVPALRLPMAGYLLFHERLRRTPSSPAHLHRKALSLRRPVAVTIAGAGGSVAAGTQTVTAERVQPTAGPLAIALLEAPGDLFELRIGGWGPHRIALASASFPQHATVVAVQRTRDGRLDVSQSFLPLADAGAARAWELREWAWTTQIAQELYKSGELHAAEQRDTLPHLLGRTWNSPVVTCLRIYASEGRIPEPSVAVAGQDLRPRAAALPDAAVALTRVGAPAAEALQPLLDRDTVPLLARSAELLAAYAVATGQGDHAAVERRARIPVGQAWTTWLLPGRGDLA